MPTKYLLVRVDTNDADYTTKLTAITDEKLVILRPLFEAIKGFTPYKAAGGSSGLEFTHDHNFPYGETLREDLGEKSTDELYGDYAEALELFTYRYLPTDDQGGCHTVESIRVLTVIAEEEIL